MPIKTRLVLIPSRLSNLFMDTNPHSTATFDIAGGTTLAMAVVRDSFEGQAGRIKMSQVSMVITIAPIIAPTLGGLLLLVFLDWRVIYATLALAGAALVAAVWLGLAESRPPHV